MFARSRPTGFTLIEVVIVMLIIGVMAVAVGLAVGGRTVEDKLDSESRRIERLLQLAVDEALVSGQDLGLRLTREGFDFVAPDPSSGGWAVIRTAPFAPRVVQQPFKLELIVDGQPVIPVRPAPKDPGKTENEASKKANEILPVVLILGSGEMTPFQLDLFIDQHPVRYRVQGNLLGELSSFRVEEQT